MTSECVQSNDRRYVYFIYNKMDSESINAIQFVGKVGKGTNDRWKSYTTSYGHGFTCALVDSPDHLNIEREIKKWGRDKGLISLKSETIIVDVSIHDSVRIVIAKYNLVVAQILDKLSTYGDIIYYSSNGLLLEKETNNTPSIISIVDEPIIQKSSTKLKKIDIEPSPRRFLLDTNDQWKKDIWYSSSKVYYEYKIWCIKHNVLDVCGNNKFKHYAGSIIYDYKKSNGVNWYKIDVDIR